MQQIRPALVNAEFLALQGSSEKQSTGIPWNHPKNVIDIYQIMSGMVDTEFSLHIRGSF